MLEPRRLTCLCLTLGVLALGEHRDDVREHLPHLTDQVGCLEALLLVPAYHADHEDHAPGRGDA